MSARPPLLMQRLRWAILRNSLRTLLGHSVVRPVTVVLITLLIWGLVFAGSLDGFWFLRDDKLDGKSFFSPTRSPFHRNQFGASAGGPIQKGKTFWFAAYEGIRQDLSLNASSLVVPSAAVRQGTLCSTIAATAICPDDGRTGPHQITGAFNPDPTTGISKSVLPYLPLFPLPFAVP